MIWTLNHSRKVIPCGSACIKVYCVTENVECNHHDRPLSVVNMRATSEERNWPESLRRYEVREHTLLGHARGRARRMKTAEWATLGELSDGCGVQW
jgi:hypothetical protein